jgi:hypothetical protein
MLHGTRENDDEERLNRRYRGDAERFIRNSGSLREIWRIKIHLKIKWLFKD